MAAAASFSPWLRVFLRVFVMIQLWNLQPASHIEHEHPCCPHDCFLHTLDDFTSAHSPGSLPHFVLAARTTWPMVLSTKVLPPHVVWFFYCLLETYLQTLALATLVLGATKQSATARLPSSATDVIGGFIGNVSCSRCKPTATPRNQKAGTVVLVNYLLSMTPFSNQASSSLHPRQHRHCIVGCLQIYCGVAQ